MSPFDTQPLGLGVNLPIPPTAPWLGDVIPAVAWSLGENVAWADPKAAGNYGLEPAEQVVVILADGLGVHLLRNRLGYAATLRAASGEPVVAQTCAPSTTAAAITTFATGQAPAKTKMVGYSVHHDGGFMNLLNFRPGLDPTRWQTTPTYFEHLNKVGTPTHLFTSPKFAGSGLTKAALRGTEFHGSESLESRFNGALNVLAAGHRFAFVYWADLDKTGHQSGPESQGWAEALENFDYELGKFLLKLPETVTVLLTADHGMVQVDHRVDIAAIPQLNEDVEVIAGEGRAVQIHARNPEAVTRRWRDYFEDDAWIFTPPEFPSVIGEGPGTELLGDLLVMPKDSYVIVDSRSQPAGAIALKGVHGSLTAREMQIPVWRLA